MTGARAVDDRVVGASASAPSACRDPSRSSGRRPSRSGPAAAPRDRASAAVGETSRPSVNAWIHVFSGAKLSSAFTWSMCECTPPCETRPIRWTRLPRSNAACEHRVREERAVRDRLVDAHQILVEPTARADRQVADLAVPHLARRQPGGRRRTLRASCAGTSAQSRSKTGVSASSTALPGPGGAQPQPSRMTSVTRGSRLGISRRTTRRRARRHRRERRRPRAGAAARPRSPA